MTAIFGEYAAKYYEKGMSVIPLHVRDKRPIPNDWSRFHDHLPDPDLQWEWIKRCPDANIGIVNGAQSRVCMVDIDTPEESLIKTIRECLPPSPWVRIGKKGMVMAYRYNGIPTFRIKDVANNTLVEMLSARTQVVLPPSIHPDTGRPYEANCDLWDVVDDLPMLDEQIESILRGAFKERGIDLSYSGWTRVTDWVPQGARDVTMTSMAGFWASGVIRGELSLLEAMERMKAWYSSCTEKIAGDDVEIEKGLANLVKFLSRDVIDKNKILPRGWDEGLEEEQKEAMGLDFSQDQEEWSFDELKSYLHEKFEQFPPESAGRVAAVEYVLKKIATSLNLTSLEEDRLLKYIQDASQLQVNIGSLRKRIRELSTGDMKGNDHTEIAQATIDDLCQYAPLRFYARDFWTWNGSHWIKKPKEDILRHIASEYGSLPAAKRNSDHHGIMKTMATLLPQEIKIVHVRGVNFANGVLMQNGELKPHDPDYGFTYTLPFRYVPELVGRATRFEQFLYQCWGEDEDFLEKKSALQEALCVTIFGMATSFQRAILLQGAPKTGKSTMLEIAKSLVPDEARAACPPDTWGDKFAPTTMHTKLINICGELSDRKPIDGQKFKQIVDGEVMSGQFKGEQIFSFHPICAHWFASNHLPRTDDSSSAFVRRWLVLKFTRPVQADQRILNYGEILVAEEREAIAAWAVEALPRILRQSEYTQPKSHLQALSEMASINNSVRYFLVESGRIGFGSGRISERKLHNAYFSFCLGEGGAKPVSPRMFRQRLSELGTELGFSAHIVDTEKGTRENVYDGITLVGEMAA